MLEVRDYGVWRMIIGYEKKSSYDCKLRITEDDNKREIIEECTAEGKKVRQIRHIIIDKIFKSVQVDDGMRKVKIYLTGKDFDKILDLTKNIGSKEDIDKLLKHIEELINKMKEMATTTDKKKPKSLSLKV